MYVREVVGIPGFAQRNKAGAGKMNLLPFFLHFPFRGNANRAFGSAAAGKGRQGFQRLCCRTEMAA